MKYISNSFNETNLLPYLSHFANYKHINDYL